MKKLILFLAGVLCMLSSCHAQQSPKKETEIPLSQIAPLKIGDTVPDVVFHHILNYKDSTARLSDFRGKLVILDFWATWCSSCIEGFSNLNNLQSKFQNKVQILLVNAKDTRDTKAKVTSFFKSKTLPNGQKYDLPIVVLDTILTQLFPHQMIPHYVWIDPSGHLIATTDAGQINEKNIQDILTGKKVSFRMKEDVLNFNTNKPLFFNKNGIDKPIKYYSVVSGYISGIPTSVFGKHNDNNLFTRLSFTNLSLMQLYCMAFQIDWPDNRIILEVEDPSDLKPKKKDNWSIWKYTHAYCYEIKTRPITKKMIYHEIQQDLDKFFGYHAEIEKRAIPCIVIKENRQIKKPVSKGGGTPTNNLGTSGEPKYIRSQPISTLIDYLNKDLSRPVSNETHFTLPLDMKLPTDLSNITLLKASLKKYGFELIESKKTMTVFVITDKYLHP